MGVCVCVLMIVIAIAFDLNSMCSHQRITRLSGVVGVYWENRIALQWSQVNRNDCRLEKPVKNVKLHTIAVTLFCDWKPDYSQQNTWSQSVLILCVWKKAATTFFTSKRTHFVQLTKIYLIEIRIQLNLIIWNVIDYNVYVLAAPWLTLALEHWTAFMHGEVHAAPTSIDSVALQ